MGEAVDRAEEIKESNETDTDDGPNNVGVGVRRLKRFGADASH